MYNTLAVTEYVLVGVYIINIYNSSDTRINLLKRKVLKQPNKNNNFRTIPSLPTHTRPEYSSWSGLMDRIDRRTVPSNMSPRIYKKKIDI